MARSSHPQSGKLDDLIRAAGTGKLAAETGLLFASRAGLALVNAAFELFECEGLYDLADGIRRDLVADSEGLALDGGRVSEGLDRAG